MESQVTITLPNEVWQLIIDFIGFSGGLNCVCFINKRFYEMLKDKYSLKLLSEKISSSHDVVFIFTSRLLLTLMIYLTYIMMS